MLQYNVMTSVSSKFLENVAVKGSDEINVSDVPVDFLEGA
jgi:hypothetical protein